MRQARRLLRLRAGHDTSTPATKPKSVRRQAQPQAKPPSLPSRSRSGANRFDRYHWSGFLRPTDYVPFQNTKRKPSSHKGIASARHAAALMLPSFHQAPTTHRSAYAKSFAYRRYRSVKRAWSTPSRSKPPSVPLASKCRLSPIAVGSIGKAINRRLWRKYSGPKI